jgi:uncharacterized glyoxalase superfamily protein PhnB
MTLYPLTGFNEEAAIEFYKKGLKQDILKRIFNEPAEPIDFAAWRTRASHYDRVDKELRANLNPRSAHPSSSSSKSRFIQSTSSTTATTTSSAAATGSAPVKIKQEQIEPTLAASRKEKGLCIICRKPGHFANVCPDHITHPTDHKGLPSGRGHGAQGQKKKSGSRTVNNVKTSDPLETSGSN